jgi:hypothetical protein
MVSPQLVEPSEFGDPDFQTTPHRYAVVAEIYCYTRFHYSLLARRVGEWVYRTPHHLFKVSGYQHAQ